MAGFGKFSIISNIYGINHVNVLWYRSTSWNPFAGNPFDDMLDAIDGLWDNIAVQYKGCLVDTMVVQRIEGVGYSDAFEIVTNTPVVRTLQEPGLYGSSSSDSAATASNIRFVLGAQQQINGLQKSKRNRGYISIGPVPSSVATDDGHYAGTFVSSNLNNLGNALEATWTDVGSWTSMIPIRIHEGRTFGVLQWRTYSDIQGYVLPTKITFRRSRLPEV